MKGRIIVILYLLMSAVASAQVDAEADSVLIVGSVLNRMTGEPEPYTVVRLLHEGRQQSRVTCDSEGMFELPLVPAGRYQLEVNVKGWTLYQSDLVLQQNAVLNIEVITDSVRLVNLREIQIVALRNLLGDSYIASADDIRLWNMHYRKGGGDHSAAVAISPDMQPDYDELDAPQSILPWGMPRKAWRFHTRNTGLKASPNNSDMKNDLILHGRIRDVRKTPAKNQ